MNHDRQSAGLASIILPCWNQVAFTQQCLAALKEHTRGDYLVLLNNDVVVTDGWLDQLIALVNAKGAT